VNRVRTGERDRLLTLRHWETQGQIPARGNQKITGKIERRRPSKNIGKGADRERTRSPLQGGGGISADRLLSVPRGVEREEGSAAHLAREKKGWNTSDEIPETGTDQGRGRKCPLESKKLHTRPGTACGKRKRTEASRTVNARRS